MHGLHGLLCRYQVLSQIQDYNLSFTTFNSPLTRLSFDKLGRTVLQAPREYCFLLLATCYFQLTTHNSKMNYIKHLSSFYSRLHEHPDLTPHHISLYMAIFQTWNAAHFRSPIHVNREELMRLSRIGSVNTFIRCLKQLDGWKLINYEPSKNINVGSCIRMITFDNRSDNTTDNTCDNSTDNTSGSNLRKPTQKETEEFFRKEGFDVAEAARFYNHYEANGWMMGKVPVQNWKAAAVNWISRSSQFGFSGKLRSLFHKAGNPKPGNLAATTRKKYDEPL